LKTRALRFGLVAGIALAGGLAISSPASAVTGFSLGNMYQYAVVIQNDTNVTLGASSNIYGNVGIGLTSGTTFSDSATIAGSVEFSNASNPFSGTTVTAGTPGSIGGTTTQTSVAFNSARVTSAISQMNALSTYYTSQTGTNVSITGTQTIAVASGTVAADSSAYVYNVTGWTAASGSTITVNGAANTWVVFNFGAGVTPNLNSNIVLTGGIASDHVLYNYTGTTNLTVASNTTINGVILDKAADITVSGTVLGRVFDGKAGGTTTISASSVVRAPEPASLAVLGTAALALFGVKRRKHA